MRELTLFNLGIDSKLRGCDLVSLKVGDVTSYVKQQVSTGSNSDESMSARRISVHRRCRTWEI